MLAQTYRDFELIIWDDASTDDSWEIIQSYSDPRMHAFRNETNLHGGNIRRGVLSLVGDLPALAWPCTAWSRLRCEYVVITDPNIYPPTLQTADATLFPENQPILMDLLDNGGRFQRVGTLPDDPGILIYKRIHK